MNHQLINKYLSGKASEKEVQEIYSWIESTIENKEAFIKYKKAWALTSKSNLDTEAAWKELKRNIRKNRSQKIYRHVLKYAALIVMVVGLGGTYNYFFNGPAAYDELQIEEEIITLILDDGTIKEINEQGEEQIVNSKGAVVGIQQGIQLNYQNEDTAEELVYNELNVPYGKKFKLLLSDGTQVQLNAGSSLRYPVRFIEGQERKVFLNGEAFFDVTKHTDDSFIVNVEDLDVRVFGTQFNISSYEEDNNINTVLVEGSVGIYMAESSYDESKSSILEPGELGAWDRDGKKMAIEKVDTSVHTAWIEGKLIFKDASFESMRNKLERHYNVSIKNNNKDLETKTFKASFDIETIGQVLETLNKNYEIEYTIIDNEIIIN